MADLDLSDLNLPPLTDATFWAILNEEIDDATVNRLVWYCLGYRPAVRSESFSADWSPAKVSADWQDYPTPPDFVESRPATVKLTRSIPPADKQLLKEALGFTGYQVSELVPRKTRRATMVNWLLSYRNQASSTQN
jgi:hypothetical protein